MNPLWVAMQWSNKRWHPLCGPVDREEAEELLTDEMTMIFPASKEATNDAINGKKGNDND